MPEPTTTSTALTLATATLSVPALTAFGVPLGLRADVLMAGFSGALAAVILLNTVPGGMDTWLELLRTTLRRMGVVLASAITAGYLTPIAAVAGGLSDPNTLGVAFAVGGGARWVLQWAIRRITSVGHHTPPTGGGRPE